jgi:hypothetical protein
MQRAYVPPTSDQMLWVVIRKSADGLSFSNYMNFIEPIMCGDPDNVNPDDDTQFGRRMKAAGALRPNRTLPFPDIEPYRLLKVATEVFMMAFCGCVVDPKVMGLLGNRDLYDEDFSGLDADDEAIRLGRGVDPESMGATWRDSYLTSVMVTLPGRFPISGRSSNSSWGMSPSVTRTIWAGPGSVMASCGPNSPTHACWNCSGTTGTRRGCWSRPSTRSPGGSKTGGAPGTAIR